MELFNTDIYIYIYVNYVLYMTEDVPMLLLSLLVMGIVNFADPKAQSNSKFN